MPNRAWQITSPGHLVLNDLGPLPEPGPKQALVRIQAVSLNYRDVLVLNHSSNYPLLAKPNLIPCSDGAGNVASVGPDSQWKAGQSVIIHPHNWMTGSDARDFDMNGTMGAGTSDGTLREYIVLDDERLLHAPEGLSIEGASTLYTAGATAWQALKYGLVKLEPGMTVLTQGTGGVSCFAIQIASAYGATVIATSSSDEKLEKARGLGATHLINYRKNPDWAAEVLKVTDAKGVDIVVDVVGANSIEQTIQATRHGGQVSLVGILSEEPNKRVDIVTSLLYGAKTIKGFLGAGSKEMLEELSLFMEQHHLHPATAQSFNFDQASAALDAVATLSAPGKVVIKMS